MHYYQFNIGDYNKHTMHLSPIEDITYRRLLDMYYDTELPIPNDIPWVSRRLRIEAGIVKSVLLEFFEPSDDGYKNHRADLEIAAYHGFLEKQKSNGIKGGRPKKTHGIPKPNPSLTQNNPKQETLNTNQQSLTIKHKPIKDNYVSPVGVLPEVWQDFVQQRKAKKAAITETAIKGIEREANKAGITLNAALQEICARGWTGFKAEWVQKGNKTEHQLRQDATAKAIFGDTSVIEMEAFNVANRLD
jgi:uncharacterized protein YdaU (DUF1376 family)